jgi:hypothetical protein
MPKYIETLSDGTTRVVHYRMKDSPVMRRICLDQAAARLDRLVQIGRIRQDERESRWHQTKAYFNRKFAPALARETASQVQGNVPGSSTA